MSSEASEEASNAEAVCSGGVYVENIKSRTELNGGFGLACGVDRLTGRVRVRMLNPRDEKAPPDATVGLKPQNLRPMRLTRYPHLRPESLLFSAFQDVGQNLKVAFEVLQLTGRKPAQCFAEQLTLSFISELEQCILESPPASFFLAASCQYLSAFCGQAGDDELNLAVLRRSVPALRSPGFEAQCSEIGKALGRPDFERFPWSLRTQLGEELRLLGRLDEAVPVFEEALGLAEKAEDAKGAAVAAGTLGTMFLSEGKLEKAQECFRKEVMLTLKRGLSESSPEVLRARLGLAQSLHAAASSAGAEEGGVDLESDELAECSACIDSILAAAASRPRGAAAVAAAHARAAEGGDGDGQDEEEMAGGSEEMRRAMREQRAWAEEAEVAVVLSGAAALRAGVAEMGGRWREAAEGAAEALRYAEQWAETQSHLPPSPFGLGGPPGQPSPLVAAHCNLEKLYHRLADCGADPDGHAKAAKCRAEVYRLLRRPPPERCGVCKSALDFADTGGNVEMMKCFHCAHGACLREYWAGEMRATCPECGAWVTGIAPEAAEAMRRGEGKGGGGPREEQTRSGGEREEAEPGADGGEEKLEWKMEFVRAPAKQQQK